MVARRGGVSGRYVCDLGGQCYEKDVLLYGEGPGSRIEYLYYKYLYTYLISPFTDIVVFFSYSIVGYAFPYFVFIVTGYAVFFPLILPLPHRRLCRHLPLRYLQLVLP